MRFAIVGTNFISDTFMEGVRLCPDCEAVAVCSRTRAGAESFAKRHKIPKVFDNCAEMLAWGEFDAVYVATPNSTHKEIAELFLNAKRHVICEKPMASNFGEVESLAATARKNGVYLHEGIVPLFSENFRIIKENLPKVGRLRQVNINMSQYSSRYDSFKRGEDPTTFRRELSNGAFMDLGVYLVALSIALFGEPQSSYGAAAMLSSGVDASTSAVLVYDGFLVNLACSKTSDSENKFEICGEEGSLIINHPTKIESVLFKCLRKGICKELAVPMNNRFYDQITEMTKLIAEGKTQSSSVPLDLSLAIHKHITKIRKEAGIVFPCDE